MSKPFFIRSNLQPFESSFCSFCCIKLKEVDHYYFNPNKRATKRYMCPACFDNWSTKRQERILAWKEYKDERDGAGERHLRSIMLEP